MLIALAIANLSALAEYLGRYEQKRDAALASQTAQSRYENGCVFVKAIASDGKPASLIPNTPVIDRSSAGFFPAGTTVCDIYGNTGRIQVKELEYRYLSPNGRFQYPKGAKIPVIDPASLAYTGNPPHKKIPDGAPIGYIGRISNIQR